MPGTLTRAAALGPAPLLEAVERYRGTIVDLDHARAVGPDEFARWRESLARALVREGLGPGDRGVVALANGPPFIATLTALLAFEASPLLGPCKNPPW